MAKKNSLSYYAGQLRDAGRRRIARLQAAIVDEKASNRTRKWAYAQAKEIISAMEGTLRFTKDGKRNKAKTDAVVGANMQRLAKAISAVEPRYTLEGDPFEVTQHQLNLASAKKPSVYTTQETKLFYYATQDLWNKKNVGEHDRNEAILDYFNAERAKAGQPEATLAEIVDWISEQTEVAKKALSAKPYSELTEEEREALDAMQRAENDDDKIGSPPVSSIIINFVRDSFKDFITGNITVN